MNKHELAAAYRVRFAELRSSWPELIAKINEVDDDRVIQALSRCAICRRFHTPPEHLVERAKKHSELEPLLQEMQKLAERTWPRRCQRLIKQLEAAIRAERS